MEINFSQAVDYLFKDGYLAQVNGEVVVTGKFKRTFNPTKFNNVEVFVPEPGPLSPLDAWNQLIKDADIPHRVPNYNGQSYTVRQYTLNTAKAIAKVINDPTINYEVLVKSIHNYYRSNAYKHTLKNYFEKLIWKAEYEETLKRPQNKPIQEEGISPFES